MSGNQSANHIILYLEIWHNGHREVRRAIRLVVKDYKFITGENLQKQILEQLNEYEMKKYINAVPGRRHFYRQENFGELKLDETIYTMQQIYDIKIYCTEGFYPELKNGVCKFIPYNP